MGKLLVFQWYYISIWSDEPKFEYEHIHVFRRKRKQVIGAKFRLEPVKLISQGDFNSKEIKRIKEEIVENFDIIKSQLYKLKNEGKVRAIKIYKKGK